MSKIIKNTLKKIIVKGIIVFDFIKAMLKEQHDSSLPINSWDMSIGRNGHLFIEGCDTVELAKDYGTPLYVVNKKRLQKDFLAFFESFSQYYPNIEVAFSYKTNPLPSVLKSLHEVGAGAEVISPFELWLALKLGVPANKIIYNGPGKSEESLNLAFLQNIKLINIDGFSEIEIIRTLSKRYQSDQALGVRVVASVGWSDQFGFPLKNGAAMKAFTMLSEIPGVRPCALHIHLGTGIKDGATYLKAIKEVLDFSVLLKVSLGIKIRYFDFGGGFSVHSVRPLGRVENILRSYSLSPRLKPQLTSESFKQYSGSIIQLVRKYFPSDEECPQIIFEPGRAISSGAQCLLLKVLAMKSGEKGNQILILDGGRNIAAPTIYEHHQIYAASKMHGSRTMSYTIYGPLCHPTDMLYPSEVLPEIGLGDILAIMDAGAYFIPNQTNFSFPRPAAVLVDDGSSKVIRAREAFQDIIALDNLN